MAQVHAVDGHHHANVDGLCNGWLDIRGHDLPEQTADEQCYHQAFPFHDETGNPVTVTVCKIRAHPSRMNAPWGLGCAAGVRLAPQCNVCKDFPPHKSAAAAATRPVVG